MTAVRVEVRFPYSKEDETKIIDAVHSSMMSALKTPDWDKTIRLIVHEPHRFTGPRDEVMIVLREHPQENWGIQGGKAASDVNIGFKINV